MKNITAAQHRAYAASPVIIYRPNKAGKLAKVKTIVVSVAAPDPHSHGLHQATHRRGKTAKGNTRNDYGRTQEYAVGKAVVGYKKKEAA